MRFILICVVLGLLFLSGCGNLSPRLNPDIQNQDGVIEELKNNQNGIIAEIGKLKQQSQIHSEKLDNFQQGLFNLNAKLSSNENSGIQILQGDGALLLVFGIATVFIIMVFYYKSKSDKNEQTADILAQSIVAYDDIGLENDIFTKAMNSNVEKEVYNLITDNQKKMNISRY